MPDKELTITTMDHNEFDCIKDNSSSLAPGSPHPEGLSELQAWTMKIKNELNAELEIVSIPFLKI